MVLFNQMDEKRLRRTIKNTVDEITNHGADDLPLGLGRAVNVRPILLGLFEEAFLFQDFHHGHDGRVGDFPAFQERFIDVAHGGTLALPDEFHDFQLLLGEGPAPVSHTNSLVLIILNVKQESRRMRPMALLIRMIETLWREVGYALRSLRKAPVFAATAVIALAFGIGGNTAMFTVIRAVLLKPLAYHDPDRLVRVSVDNPRFNAPDSSFTLDHFEHMRTARSFSAFGAFLSGTEDMTLSGGGTPEGLKGARVSANFLDVLGVKPAMGRSFLPEEDRPGGPSVAMISTSLWVRQFGADPRMAGRVATINATPYTIVGVLPAGFDFPLAGTDVWVTRPSEWSVLPSRYWRNVALLGGFARLKSNVSVEQARAELNVLRNQYAAAHPGALLPSSRMRVTPLHDQMVARVRSMLWMLFGAVACVLLIACANVASLLLARGAARSREFAVRVALGAGRGRLVQQLLAESLVLAAAGGALGLLLARWGLGAISSVNGLYVTRTGPILPRAAEIRLDGSVLWFTVLVALGTGVLFGLLPSLEASRVDLAGALRESGAAAGSGSAMPWRIGRRGRGLIVVGQIALTTVLLIGAGLLIETFARLHGVKSGFQPENLLTLKIALPPARYDSDAKKAAFFNELVRRAETVPGVLDAAAAITIPGTTWLRTNVQLPGQPEVPGLQKFAVLQSVTPGYFRALRIPLRRGRAFSNQDNTPGAPPAMIINERLARLIWPEYPGGIDPVGQHLFEGADKFAGAPQVVGIVGDVHEGGLADDAVPEFYVPTVVHSPQVAYMAVRTAADPEQFANAIRRQVMTIDRDQPVEEVRTMTAVLESSVGPRRLALFLLSIFAGLALLLAIVGVYGVMAFSVEQRVRELGIRRALGAQRGDILRVVLYRGMALAIAGITIGFLGALVLTRFLTDLLFQVKPLDPTAFLGMSLLFLIVSLGASWVPGWRATRIDPMTALRIG